MPRARGNPRRRRALLALSLLVLLGAAAWFGYGWQVLRHFEETDNAYGTSEQPGI